MSEINLSRNKFYKTENQTVTYTTSEFRAMNMPYTDPLWLNFKLMIDLNKSYGLFAPEENVDSALAYLKRIGELNRYEALKHWINLFQGFVKNFDFLILECNGIDEVTQAKHWETFIEGEQKISIVCRETSDMLIQSIISMYKFIWFDSVRMVEVIPVNLRRFDINILIYSAGYWNMAWFDVRGNNGLTSEDIETQIFPTIRKLSDEFFTDNAPQTYEFNHHMISLGDCQIDNEDSGKTFFESLSNEMSGDFRKNNLVFTFRFATPHGMFNNLFGKIDFVKVLAIAAAQDNVSNQLKYDSNKVSTTSMLEKQLPSGKKSLVDRYKNKLINENTAIGNAIKTLSDPTFLKTITKNSFERLQSDFDRKFVNHWISKLNNVVFKSYSDSFQDIYENYLKENPKNISSIENVQMDKSDINSNIKLFDENSNNIFKRKGF